MTRSHLTLALSLVVATACGDTNASTPAVADAPESVRVADVTTDAISTTIRGTGVLGAKDEIPLSFKIGGIIADITADAGNVVSRGSVLARLDLREINALVAKAAAAVTKAERDSVRVARLYTDSVASLAQWQDVSTALTAARADLATATVNREFAVITAPHDGVILARAANPGALAAPGQPVLTLASRTRGSVLRVGLADRDALRVARGDSARITFAALPDTTFVGVVTQRAAVTDARSGTITIEITVQGGDALPTGLVGSAVITPRRRGTHTTIPVAALLEGDGDAAIVYTVRDGRAVRVPVRIVRFVGTDRVAVSGLDGVDHVVISGGAYLTNGTAAVVRS